MYGTSFGKVIRHILLKYNAQLLKRVKQTLYFFEVCCIMNVMLVNFKQKAANLSDQPFSPKNTTALLVCRSDESLGG